MSMPANVLSEACAGREPAASGNLQLAFTVAGLRVEMVSVPGGPVLEAYPALDPFLTKSGPAGMSLSVDWAEEIPTPEGRPVFDSGGVWTLYRRGSDSEFIFRSPATGDAPYKAAILDDSFRHGRVLLSRHVFGRMPAVYPLEYPLDELLVIHRLAQGEGVEVHACGVVDERGRGLLFAGHSGAGKSTLARLWQGAGGARILSDDRVILRRDPEPAGRGRILMHGTPWHGEARLALPMAAPLCGVYFLEHALRNEFEALAPGRAAAELLARSFLPYHDAAGLEFALQFFAGVVAETPCSVFRFVPDATAVRGFGGNERVY